MTFIAKPIWEHGVEGGRSRPIDCDMVAKLLCDIGETLDSHGIKHVLFLGTLLGAVRDKAIIPWDDDCDLAVFMPDRAQWSAIARDLESLGCFVPPEGDPAKPIADNNMPKYDTCAIRDGEKCDCWWFVREDPYYIYDRERCGDIFRFSTTYFDDLQDYDFLGRTWKIPADAAGMCRRMYGKTWQTPTRGKKMA